MRVRDLDGRHDCATICNCASATLLPLSLVSTTADYRTLNLNDQTPWGTNAAAITLRLQNYVSANFFARNQLLIKSMANKIATAVEHKSFEQQAAAQRQAIKDSLLNPPNLSLIKAPTLILHGDEDQIIPVQSALDLHAGVANSELFLFKGDGHLLLAENAGRFDAEGSRIL